MLGWFKGKSGGPSGTPERVDIFLSYARDDKERVAPLAQLLEAQGWLVFWDPQIRPGERWDELIQDKLASARCVIVVWTARSIRSQWVKDEAGKARDRKILVPVSLDGTEPPLGFGQTQTAQLGNWPQTDGTTEIEFVLAGVRRLIGDHASGLHTKLDLSQALGADGRVWMTLRDTVSPVLLRTFIVQHPTSVYRPFAEALLQTLEASAPAAGSAVGSAAGNSVQPAPIAAVAAPTAATGSATLVRRRRLQVGKRFRDHEDAPEMVVVPAGRFWMGAGPEEAGRQDNELPRHRVTIAQPFAVGVFPVTYEEFDHVVAAGGTEGYVPPDQGWGRGRRPAINVSWSDAKAYLAWLSTLTDRPYRLLSEAEWEYACRAGTETPYSFGAELKKEQALFGLSDAKTVEVGRYPANAFGLHDMHGLVWEWVEDSVNASYAGAPTDGSAWRESGVGSGSEWRVARGGCAGNPPNYLRSACRWWPEVGRRDKYVGFRVARDLTDKEQATVSPPAT